MTQPNPKINIGATMPRLNMDKDAKMLSQAELDYMKLAQQQNIDRVNRLKKLRRTNMITAGVLAVATVGIFGYSMWSVGSEKFLDEFDKATSKKEKN